MTPTAVSAVDPANGDIEHQPQPMHLCPAAPVVALAPARLGQHRRLAQLLSLELVHRACRRRWQERVKCAGMLHRRKEEPTRCEDAWHGPWRELHPFPRERHPQLRVDRREHLSTLEVRGSPDEALQVRLECRHW
eukprot:CAMPEP_0182564940 /NCGR_PEP_ID=MMETSP1324-20130603/6776_1 /TAXON_ID=236786 /ORGANISM="Florenciella sp., Strain RCC1587" /LENGTH=134 /DNA_ID=CAMNT_0024778501 /DNA_START=213 /DNA_END=618 /DNA_ORIENTATION=-